MKIDLQTKELIKELSQCEENNDKFQELLIKLFNKNETLKKIEDNRILEAGISFLKGNDYPSFINDSDLEKTIVKALQDKEFVENYPPKTSDVLTTYLLSLPSKVRRPLMEKILSFANPCREEVTKLLVSVPGFVDAVKHESHR